MLEVLRRSLWRLVPLIERRERRIVYTDFEDEMGGETAVVLPGLRAGGDLSRFRQKAQAYLRAHLDHVSLQKLRTNRPLTSSDLAELERMLAASGAGSAADIAQAASEAQGLGLFVRSLVGLDREAAKAALGGFVAGHVWSANQIEFLDLVVDHLTEHGIMEPRRLYESPFTDLAPHGPESLFPVEDVDRLIVALERLSETATAA